jgi:hypothetical protein
MAATNKCLAQSNKSRTGAKATKKRNRASEQVQRERRGHFSGQFDHARQHDDVLRPQRVLHGVGHAAKHGEQSAHGRSPVKRVTEQPMHLIRDLIRVLTTEYGVSNDDALDLLGRVIEWAKEQADKRGARGMLRVIDGGKA